MVSGNAQKGAEMTNGTNGTTLSTPAQEPTDAELLPIAEKFIAEKGLKVSPQEAIGYTPIRKALVKLYLAKSADTIQREAEERRLVNNSINIAVGYIQQKIIELRARNVAINPELMGEIPEPTLQELAFLTESILSEVGIQIQEQLRIVLTPEQVLHRVDSRNLVVRLWKLQKELTAKEGAKDIQSLLEAIQADDAKISEPPKPEPKVTVEPQWKRVFQNLVAVEEKDSVEIEARIIRCKEESRGMLPWALFNTELDENDNLKCRNLLAGARGFLIGRKIELGKKIELIKSGSTTGNAEQLEEKAEEIQEIIDLITKQFKIIFNQDPGERSNFCPPDLYKQSLKLFQAQFKELLRIKSPQERTVDLDKRRLLISQVQQILESKGGVVGETAEKVAHRIVKKFNGDIHRAALGKREELDQLNLSEQDRQTIHGQLQTLAAAAEISLEQIEKEFVERQSERKAAEKKQNARKDEKLTSQVARPLSVAKARQLAEQSKKVKQNNDKNKK